MNKKLFRSVNDKMLGGVAGGLGEYFEIDPTIIRIIFVVTLFMGGAGVVAYLLLWIFVPQRIYIPNVAGVEPNTTGTGFPPQSQPMQDYLSELEEKRSKRSMTAGIILIIFGMIFLADNFLPRINFGDLWPLILIGIGAGLLLTAKKI